jgi:hypothetical protein
MNDYLGTSKLKFVLNYERFRFFYQFLHRGKC